VLTVACCLEDLKVKKNIELDSLIAGINALVIEADRKWGTDQLRLKVGSDLRFKWDAQWKRYQAAVEANHLPSVRDHAKSVTKGFAALELEAASLGNKPVPPSVWTTVAGPRNTPVAIVREKEHMNQVEDGTVAFTLDELVMMIPANIIHIKSQFTGTRVINWKEVELVDDEIPF
jgi:hypothetical protein